MATKRRKGRPRKPGHRYRNGNLRPSSHEPAVSPAAIAATQPHRAGLGDCAADQKAESELGRMVLRSEISALQYLAGQRYAAQWRAYLATLDGPRSPQRGQGRGSGCNPADCRERGANCACDLARRLWTRSTFALAAAGPQAIVVIARVCCWDVPCPSWAKPVLICGLDALAESLGLTTRNKSRRVENLNPNYVRA
jgi:hypothetical protein